MNRMKYLLDGISRELDPLDEAAFYGSDQKFWAEATDCRTGGPVFFEKNQPGIDFMDAVRASASLPLMGRMVKVGRDVCLDGGVADPVPLPAELPCVCGKTVLVLTRQAGFRKGGQHRVVRRLYRRRYGAHPELLEACLTGPERYNQRMDEIDREIASHAPQADGIKGAARALEKELQFEIYATGMTDESLTREGAKPVSVAAAPS